MLIPAPISVDCDKQINRVYKYFVDEFGAINRFFTEKPCKKTEVRLKKGFTVYNTKWMKDYRASKLLTFGLVRAESYSIDFLVRRSFKIRYTF